MTNKRKIAILKKLVKRFEHLIPEFDEDLNAYQQLEKDAYGICNYICCNLLSKSESRTVLDWLDEGENDLTDYMKKEFKIRMPRSNHLYEWELTKEGYQARVRACKKAIERLQNEK